MMIRKNKILFFCKKIYLIIYLFPLFCAASGENKLLKSYQIAQKAMKEQDWSGAKKALQFLVTQPQSAFSNPFTFFDLHLQLAIVEIEQGFYKDALLDLENLENLQPPAQFINASKFLYAKILAKQNQVEKAWETLLELQKRVPFADWPQEQKIFHHSLSFQQDQTYDAMLAQADEAFTNNKWEIALSLYDHLILAIESNLYPKASKQPQTFTHIHFYAAKVHAQLLQYEKAALGFAKALTSLQDVTEAEKICLEYAFCLLKINQPKKTLAVLNKVSTSSEHFALCLIFRTLANLQLKQVDQALQCQMQFINLKQHTAKSIDKMAEFCERIAEKTSISQKMREQLLRFYSNQYKRNKTDAIFLAILFLKQAPPQKKWLETHSFSSITKEAKAYWHVASKMDTFADKQAFLNVLMETRFANELYSAHAHRINGLRKLPIAKRYLQTNPKRAKNLLVEVENHLSQAIAIYEQNQSPLLTPCRRLHQEALGLLYTLP